ncbi:MAG: signal peptide peptidase SppA [Propionibacteriales bacterium]|nr:signal peptide peptidase SppA [Propionibacteriales bacterium]
MDFADAIRQRLNPSSAAPTVLELDLSRGVLATAPSGPREALRSLHAPTMRAVREGLRAAATDDTVAGLVIHVAEGNLSLTQADEIGALISAFAKHKPTLAQVESFGELTSGLVGYRLASHAQQIWLQPSGGLGLNGLSAEVMLLRGTLDKVGIEPEFSQRHEYKTAANQFAAHEVTGPQREMMQRIVDSVLEDTVAEVAANRSLDPDAVREAVGASPLTATEAERRGLVDRVGYRDEAYAWVKENWGRVGDDGPEVTLKFVHRWAKEKLGNGVVQQLRDKKRAAIAVVGVHGGIVTGPSQPGGLGGQTAGSDTVCAHLRAAGADSSVKAVVLRVDSPGGSYVASDAIRREVLRLRETGRPVVASMGGAAASGGYFVSMGADKVVAGAATLTGSIGVLAGKMVTAGLTERIGLVREELTAGENAAMFSTLHPFTDAQRAKLDAWLDEVYEDFTRKASADRKLPYETLEPLARGRVWTGSDAVARGLVDEIGGMDTAIDHACVLAGVDRDAVVARGVPAVPFLSQFRPADSSEAPNAHTSLGSLGLESWGLGALDLAAQDGSPEALFRRVTGALGLTVGGVLSLPYRITLG